jgi:TrmH family RNA methyltransferase
MIDYCNKNEIMVYTTHLEAKRSLYEVDFTGKTAIIIGNESKGVSKDASSKADHLIKIPMPGNAESLNASVASSIIMYEYLRQKL